MTVHGNTFTIALSPFFFVPNAGAIVSVTQLQATKPVQANARAMEDMPRFAYWPTIHQLMDKVIEFDPQHMKKLKLMELRLLLTSLLFWDGVEPFTDAVERVLNISEFLWVNNGKRPILKAKVLAFVNARMNEDKGYLHDLWYFVRRTVKEAGVRPKEHEVPVIRYDPKKNRYALEI